MKSNSLHILKAVFVASLTLGFLSAEAQAPANDKCSGAIELTLFDSEANAVPTAGDTRNTVDAASDGIPVCSGNFYRDDVWYKVTAPASPNFGGYAIKFYYGTEPTDFIGPGIAIYNSCGAGAQNAPIFCANAPAGDVAPFCLAPNQTVYIRVWSNDGPAANWQAGWGTFRIAAFERPQPANTDIILWGDTPGEGDFDGGTNGWTSVGILCSNNAAGNPVPADSAKWVWDARGAAPGAYSAGQNLTSRSVCNGAMVFNSDRMDNAGTAGNFGNGSCPADQEGALVSPTIDLSAFNVAGVSLVFHQSLRQFQSAYFVGYSLDGGQNWSDIEINQQYETNSAHINEEVRVALPGAAGASNLKIRFRIEANYYYWVIDDVRIVETEANNMRANDFFAIAPNAVWQKDQLTDFGALIDIENIGAVEQKNVKVNYTITDESGNVVVSGVRNYGNIGPDSLAENQPFANCFNLPADASGLYVGEYTVSSDSADFDETNNSQSFRFMISDNLMAKEMPGGTFSGLRPVAASGSLSYAMGNHFSIVNGDDYKVCEVELGVSNANALTPSALGGVQASVIIYLYEWEDLNGDGNCQTQSEVNTAGFAQYDFQDGDPANSVFTIPLFETANFEQCVPLKNNTQYLLVMEYTEPAGVPAGAPLFMLMTNEFKYAANRLLTSPVAAGGLGQCVPQYGEFLNAGLADDVLNNGAFNSGEVPLLRMLMEPISSTEEPGTEPVVEATVNILPNPVNDLLRVDMDFVRTMDKVNVRVSDLTGRVVMEENFSGITTMSWSQSAAHLANGSYLVHITTPEGVRTQKFVVQH